MAASKHRAMRQAVLHGEFARIATQLGCYCGKSMASSYDNAYSAAEALPMLMTSDESDTLFAMGGSCSSAF